MIITHLQINKVLALNNIQGVDMPSNKPNRCSNFANADSLSEKYIFFVYRIINTFELTIVLI